MSGLVFKYGSYTGDECLVKMVSHNVTPRLTNNYPTSYIRTLTIEGRIEADGAANISTAMQALEDALNVHAQDGGVYTAGGSATKHTIISANTMYGNTVMRVDYPPTDLQMATEQLFVVTLQGEYLNSFFSTNDLSLNETISVVGDGDPITVLLNSSVGGMIRHQVNPQSSIIVTQQGTTEGRTSFPNLPAKIITDPDAKQAKSSRDTINIVGIGTSSQKYVRSYSWTWEIDAPLSSLPTPNQLT